MSTFHVKDTADFNAAVAKASSGDEIRLAAGVYGKLSIYNRTFDVPLIISADPETEVTVQDLRIDNSTGLVLRDFSVGRSLVEGEPEWTFMARIRNSSDIQIDGISFRGSLDGSPANDGIGLIVTDSQGISVLNSEFQQLFRGITVHRGTDTIVQSSSFHDLRSDGVQVAASDNTKVAENLFFDFYPIASDHADAIQFFNTGQAKGSRGINIENNMIRQGAGLGSQGIWISDGLTHRHSDVFIKNNLIHSNSHYQGIGVNDATSVLIEENTLVSEQEDVESYWIHLRNSQDVRLVRNVTDDIKLINSYNVTQTDNVVLSRAANPAELLPGLSLGVGVSPDGLMLSGAGFKAPRAALSGSLAIVATEEYPSPTGQHGSLFNEHQQPLSVAMVGEQSVGADLLEPASEIVRPDTPDDLWVETNPTVSEVATAATTNAYEELTRDERVGEAPIAEEKPDPTGYEGASVSGPQQPLIAAGSVALELGLVLVDSASEYARLEFPVAPPNEVDAKVMMALTADMLVANERVSGGEGLGTAFPSVHTGISELVDFAPVLPVWAARGWEISHFAIA